MGSVLTLVARISHSLSTRELLKRICRRLAGAAFRSHLFAIGFDRSFFTAADGRHEVAGGKMAFPNSATWQYAEALARGLTGGEKQVRRGFWRKLKRVVASLPFAEDLITAHYCAFDRHTPPHVKAVLIGALAYFVLPEDAIPDYIPVIGYMDDAAVLATALKLVTSHITQDHREAARRMLARLRDEA
jgi:uncharacterized membrane protein YkvA (DUF1232 family)